jgi:hypothetical protein
VRDWTQSGPSFGPRLDLEIMSADAEPELAVLLPDALVDRPEPLPLTDDLADL